MTIVIGATEIVVLMYEMLKATDNFLKSKGINIEDYE